jgi:uncharacterized protein with ParB-like and HNH nuclease domain
LRLFNTLNNRGIPFTPADIIKVNSLELIKDEKEQASYASKWIEFEEKLGREELGELLSHIYTMKDMDKGGREAIMRSQQSGLCKGSLRAV